MHNKTNTEGRTLPLGLLSVTASSPQFLWVSMGGAGGWGNFASCLFCVWKSENGGSCSHSLISCSNGNAHSADLVPLGSY